MNRKEYKDVIPRLGIKPKFEILLLSPEDYIKGPCSDKDKERKGNVWSFVKEREKGEESIYIKLKIEDGICKCLSMHPPRLSYHFPHK